jgi:outer membrane immunogenic protein
MTNPGTIRNLLLTAAGVIALASPAFAADIPVRTYKAPPAPPPAPIAALYNWTGFYIGGHVGGAFAGDNSLLPSDARFLGGVQGGADYQFANNWVVGIEGQYSWLANNHGGVTFPPAGFASQDTRGIGSATARVGWTWGPGLLYVKGGYAFTDKSLGVTVAGVPQPFAVTGNDKSGYTLGAGFEYMFAPNWSAKAEYQYYNFGNTTFTAASPAGLAGANFRDDEHTVKVGINYRFGWGNSPAR